LIAADAFDGSGGFDGAAGMHLRRRQRVVAPGGWWRLAM